MLAEKKRLAVPAAHRSAPQIEKLPQSRTIAAAYICALSGWLKRADSISLRLESRCERRLINFRSGLH
jgi:hypothetical protein